MAQDLRSAYRAQVTVAVIAAFLLDCGGTTLTAAVDPGRGHQEGASASNSDGGIDSQVDAPHGDAHSADAQRIFDASYPPLPVDAARLDGCSPRSCDDLCVTDIISACYQTPKVCGPNPTCLCIVEAAWWCAEPKCTADGGYVLSCLSSQKGGPP